MSAIAYQDFVQDGRWVPGSGTSPLALDLSPLDNALTPQLGVRWEAEHGLAQRVIEREFASPTTPVDLVALLDVRYEGALSISLVYGPGRVVIEPSTPIIEYASSDFTVNAFFLLPARIVTSRIGFLFSGAHKDVYSVGRIWAGPVFVPPQGLQRDWKTGVVDAGEMVVSPGRQGYSKVRDRTRRLSMRFSHVDFAQAFGVQDNSTFDFQQLSFRIGATDPVIVLPRTRKANGDVDVHAIHRVGMYCHLLRPLKIAPSGGGYFSAALEADELL